MNVHLATKAPFQGKGSTAALHIATLFTLAIAHPLYDLLIQKDHVTFFVAHQSKAIDVWLFVLFLTLLFPLSLYLILCIVSRLSRYLADALYTLLFASLAMALFLPISEQLLSDSGNLSIFLGLLAAAMVTFLYFTTSWAHTFVTLMSPVIVLSPLLFLSSEPIKSFLTAPENQDYEILSKSRKMPDIVMIVFDDFPLTSLLDEDRQIDSVRYPNFHRLVKTSTWYRNATTIHYGTAYATPSILTGRDYYSDYLRRFENRHPRERPDVNTFPDNLFSLFKTTHRIVALESTTKVAPASEITRKYGPALSERFPSLLVDAAVLCGHKITPRPLRHRLPSIYGRWRDFLRIDAALPPAKSDWPYKGEKARKMKQFLDSLHESDQPVLYFAHILFPHLPFVYNEVGQLHDDKSNIPDVRVRIPKGKNVWPSERTANVSYQAHLLQLSFVDLLLGLVLDRLSELDLFDSSLIVITADHGMSFYWDPTDMPSEKLFAVQASDTMYVPLIIKAPHQRKPELSDKIVQTIDILPTLADMLEVDIPWQVDGSSALADDRPREKRFVWFMSKKYEEFGSVIDPDYLSLKRKIALFGSRNFDSLYSYGPHKEIVGQPLESFPSRDSNALVAIVQRERFLDIEPAGSSVPAYIEGDIIDFRGIIESDQPKLAIAVNGVIRSTAGVSEEDGRLNFVTRVPPTSFVSGQNEVTIHAIEEDEHGEPV
jgi:hypothetical protein